jgi:3-oxoacyl-(acyl-carrier-protein) synthase
MSRRRVVITGLGTVTAHGVGIDPLWSALCEGRSALAPIRAFDASGFRAASGATQPAAAAAIIFISHPLRAAGRRAALLTAQKGARGGRQ